MGDAPMAALSNLWLASLGCNNCRLHGRDEEARQWLAEAAADFRAVEAYQGHSSALQARSLYLYMKEGTAESLDAENREAGRKRADGAACLYYLASLFQQRGKKTDDALEYLRTVRDNGEDILPFARVAFLLDKDVDAARAECRRALKAGVRSRYDLFLCNALSLAGMPEEARQQAKAFRDNPLVALEWDVFRPCGRRVAAHAYDGTFLDVDGEIGASRWKRFIAYDTLGFAALGRGERETARKYLRKAAEHPPVFTGSYPWLQAIRARVINDPNWPPWLAEKK
jgi:hypothetical protein